MADVLLHHGGPEGQLMGSGNVIVMFSNSYLFNTYMHSLTYRAPCKS